MNVLNIELQNPCQFDDIPSEHELMVWANAGVVSHSEQPFGVVVRVVDNNESADLNNQFRGKNTPTNVLSFPFEAPPFPMEYKHLGDLVICKPRVHLEAQQQNKTLKQHWAHLLVHGMLHLQGYDHVADQEAEEMEALEVEILGKLGFANPYEEITGDNEQNKH